MMTTERSESRWSSPAGVGVIFALLIAVSAVPRAWLPTSIGEDWDNNLWFLRVGAVVYFAVELPKALARRRGETVGPGWRPAWVERLTYVTVVAASGVGYGVFVTAMSASGCVLTARTSFFLLAEASIALGVAGCGSVRFRRVNLASQDRVRASRAATRLAIGLGAVVFIPMFLTMLTAVDNGC